MPTALQLAEGHPALQDAVRRSRALLHRRALVSAGVGMVPLPGLDWAVNAAQLSRLIPKINREFGLDASQLDQLTPHKREQVQKAVNIVGTVLVGKVLTRELLVVAGRHMGVRLTGQQAAKLVPVAGQAAAALIGYTALRYLGELHIKDCVQVCLAAQNLLAHPLPPAPKLR